MSTGTFGIMDHGFSYTDFEKLTDDITDVEDEVTMNLQSCFEESRGCFKKISLYSKSSQFTLINGKFVKSATNLDHDDQDGFWVSSNCISGTL